MEQNNSPRLDAREAVLAARQRKTAVPAFNIPHLPMVEPVAAAVADAKITAIIHVARVEWEKFSAGSLEAVAAEYRKYEKPGYTLLGLDHVPVVDEDHKRVDYMPILRRAVDSGYRSVMIDGSRLPLAENIAATQEAASLAHGAGLACEGELGAVMGHESGPIMPYEEIFRTRLGFTSIEDAERFVNQSHCDWLSVAVGNIHGAVAEAARNQKKPEARLDVDHIAALYKAVGIPLVLHGGSGIQIDYIKKGIQAGIAKINIGTEIRQAYEKTIETKNSVKDAQDAVYAKVRELIENMSLSPSGV
ncbi:MAG: class II fructose-bisphosphate aldolase [Treponema sp.]|jgi:ketose-bisphosphate aldolase|nr:class II fructose-bisphosphate aldolase [Treponema sp.]